MTRESSALNVARRRIELARAADETVDVLVVGGGITGVGVALDAASRGLRVTLIEAEDLAFGTSRFSSKLVHGGLRYLATGDIATARESAHERHLLMTTIAPHLIRPLGQLLPFSRGVTLRQRTAGAVGMGLGDLLRMRAHTTRTTLPAPALVSARSATRLVPALDPHGLRGGMLSFDGQLVDDARLVATVARTAASLGARILTRVRAVVLREDGASVEETTTGERFDIRARAVINATGVWAGALDQTIHVRPSRGTHIVLAAADLGSPSTALAIPHEGSISRYVFALPQGFGRVIVGLTDEDSPGVVPRVARPTEPEIDFLLQNLNRVIAAPLGRDRVRGAFAGLRPLVDSGTDSTADVSRRHLVTVSTAGFVTVLGGKLTTYRRMAEDAVDLAGRTRGLQSGRSRTASLRLVDREVPASDDVLDDATGLTTAEVEFAVHTEGAMSVDDVLDRRTRVGLVDADRARCHAAVENVVARTLADLA
ncbi:glycerol-3-phosphate dehydrogenase/oxidase [Microbacterium sp. STF-2]|uniref:glycerol-3-phosphate dehydrogenase/oxidase n=1 Tax=Microbacterium sp. STF-2 TaxID=3031132 RepID=UPI002AFEE314|nr:glycerol-3-phosphate dehydrogenase/oxidase [Microbacterium sp. STF-2]MEA1261782.1 glycerol-3-phosphate dehydrogenase/oxidase [Microbacterium sp. STF-2]